MGFESRLLKLEARAGITDKKYSGLTQEQLRQRIHNILLPTGIDFLGLSYDDQFDLLCQLRRDFAEMGYKVYL